MPAEKKWIEADAYVFDIDGTLLNAFGGAHYNGDWIETTDARHLDLEGQNERSTVNVQATLVA